MPVEYIYEPWKASKEVQKKAGCVIGSDYPERIVVHEEVAMQNARKMEELKNDLLRKMTQVNGNLYTILIYCKIIKQKQI